MASQDDTPDVILHIGHFSEQERLLIIRWLGVLARIRDLDSRRSAFDHIAEIVDFIRQLNPMPDEEEQG